MAFRKYFNLSSTGDLWVVGFNMFEDIPDYPDPFQDPFYYPCLANIPSGSDEAEVIALLGTKLKSQFI